MSNIAMTSWDPRIVRFWADRLGVDVPALLDPGCTVQSQDRPNRLIVYSRGDSHVIVCPLQSAVRPGMLPAALTAEALSAWLGAPLELRWTDLLAYTATLVPAPELPLPARALTAADALSFEALKAACSADERALAQITLDDPLIVGCFEGHRLVAVASTLDVNADIADIGVLTHPGWRGRGLAAGLSVCLRNAVVEAGRVAQYTTSIANRGSVRTLEKAGFDVFLVEQGYVIRGEAL